MEGPRLFQLPRLRGAQPTNGSVEPIRLTGASSHAKQSSAMGAAISAP